MGGRELVFHAVSGRCDVRFSVVSGHDCSSGLRSVKKESHGSWSLGFKRSLSCAFEQYRLLKCHEAWSQKTGISIVVKNMEISIKLQKKTKTALMEEKQWSKYDWIDLLMLQICWPIKYNPSESKCETQKKKPKRKNLTPNHWIYDSTYVSMCRKIWQQNIW